MRSGQTGEAKKKAVATCKTRADAEIMRCTEDVGTRVGLLI